MATVETAYEVRVFQLYRDRDVTGRSGTGVVADGVVWPDGSVSMRWRGAVRTTVSADSLADIERVHGHDGATRVVLLANLTIDGGAAWTAA